MKYKYSLIILNNKTEYIECRRRVGLFTNPSGWIICISPVCSTSEIHIYPFTGDDCKWFHKYPPWRVGLFTIYGFINFQFFSYRRGLYFTHGKDFTLLHGWISPIFGWYKPPSWYNVTHIQHSLSSALIPHQCMVIPSRPIFPQTVSSWIPEAIRVRIYF